MGRVGGGRRLGQRATSPGSAGFTLVELVVVLVLMGILATVAAPRLFTSADFEQEGFADEVRAALEFARKSAIASRRFVCVGVSGGNLTFSFDVRAPESIAGNLNCAAALNLPASRCAQANQVCAPSSVTLAGAAINFDPRGRPVAADRSAVIGSTSLSVGGYAVTVAPETGDVH